MKMYVVTTGTYSDYSIDTIWSTREKAEEYMKSQQDPEGDDNKVYREDQPDFNEIKEMEIDAAYEPKVFTTWWKWLLDGQGNYMEVVRNATSEWYERERLSAPRHKGRGWVDINPSALQYPEKWKDYHSIEAHSPISREHARKLAEEAWQRWLRTKPLFDIYKLVANEKDELVTPDYRVEEAGE